MAAVYGSATINNIVSKGNAKPVQDMVGTSIPLRADSNFMQNGHIGTGQDQVVGAGRAPYIAADGTHAIGHLGDGLVWSTSTGSWSVGP